MDNFLLTQIPILEKMESISLFEMKDIQLMNRIDTKYITSISNLPILLEKAKEKYRVQIINGESISPYQTLYYDTSDSEMYTFHHNKKLQRQKIRTRTYLNSKISFLEIKKKTNKGRTQKERIQINNDDYSDFSQNKTATDFVDKQSGYISSRLKGQVLVFFDRITLVNNEKTERLTIDCNLSFKNCETGYTKEMPDLMIIELKQNGFAQSDFKDFLFEMRIKPVSISKYCLGTVLTKEGPKKNNFKRKMIFLDKMV